MAGDLAEARDHERATYLDAPERSGRYAGTTLVAVRAGVVQQLRYWYVHRCAKSRAWFVA